MKGQRQGKGKSERMNRVVGMYIHIIKAGIIIIITTVTI